MNFNKSKILIAGTGSIAKRHALNLTQMGLEVEMFTRRELLGKNQKLGNVTYIYDFEKGLKECEALIIANRTDLHIDLAIKAAKQGKHMLIEKPLSHNLEGIDTLVKYVDKNSIHLAPGFMLRFHPNIIFLKHYLSSNPLGKIHYVRALVGQYLPDWRPDSDYKKGYGAKKEYGGGVILDLIHEIDLSLYLFGEVSSLTCLKQYTKELKIETESIASISYKSKDGILINIILDYLRPIMGRNMEIVCENGIITWDFVKGEIYIQTKEKPMQSLIHKVSSSFNRNDMYIEEIKSFLKVIDKEISLDDKKNELDKSGTLNDAIKSLQVAMLCHNVAGTIL